MALPTATAGPGFGRRHNPGVLDIPGPEKIDSATNRPDRAAAPIDIMIKGFYGK